MKQFALVALLPFVVTLSMAACGSVNLPPGGLTDVDVSADADVPVGDVADSDLPGDATVDAAIDATDDAIPSDAIVPNCTTVADCEGKITVPDCRKAVCQEDGLCGLAAAEDGGTCDDGNACIENGTCKDGHCAGSPITCDDGKACTDDACDPKTGCTATPNTAPCDDGDACTVDDACAEGSCKGAAKSCNDGNPCTDDTCSAAEGCKYALNKAECVDGNACTTGDECFNGTCVGGAPKQCDDGNPCTTDSCDVATGCQNVAVVEGSACSDDDACTVEDKCAAGKCQGSALSCDDNEACTKDSCDKVTGCTNTADDTATCSDGNSCTKTDVCKDGKCQGTNGKTCDDSNVCTDDACKDDVCIFTANTQACEDGNKCTDGDACADKACKPGLPLACDDGNPCTTDTCDAVTGTCAFANNTLACNDNNACTTGDTCGDGACAGKAKECGDSNPCTTDACTAATGTCANVVRADGSECSDDSVCTQSDGCKAGKCQGIALTCDDGNPCTDDTCDPVGGCAAKNNTATCDDGNSCTQGDACSAGECKAGATALKCDDANACTTDACDPAKGCTYANSTAVCDDANACTVSDQCSNGKCVGSAKVCDDAKVCTNDSCDPAKGCVFANNTALCSDGSICTATDKCANGTCVGSGLMTCDDQNACTTDTCDPKVGCKFAAVADGKACDDGSSCTNSDACKAGKCVGVGTVCDDNNPCTTDSCTNGVCAFTANTLPCNDGNVCTLTDTCNGKKACVGTNLLKCDDVNPCTNDVCDPAKGCIFVNNNAPCDDGAFCTANDACKDGKCQLSVAKCNDGNVCTNDACDEATDKCMYQANLATCSDKDACTVDDVCKNAVCVAGPKKVCNDNNPCTADSCNATTGECVYALGIPALCQALAVPVSLPIDYADPLWVGSSNNLAVKWMADATPPAPGKLTGAASLNLNDGNHYAFPAGTQATALGKFVIDASKVSGSYLTFVFYSYHGVQADKAFDKRIVEFSTDGFATVAKAYTLDNTKFVAQWHMESLDINSLVGKTFQVRFRFDTVTAVPFPGPGWFVDEVNVYAGPVVTPTAAMPFLEPFNNNTNGWQFASPVANASWAIDATPAIPAPLSAPTTLNFNNGTNYAGLVSGSALSPVIDLEGVTSKYVTLMFREWGATDVEPTDVRWVEASTDAFVSTPVKVLFGNQAQFQSGWRYGVIDLGPFAGKKLRLRFAFDSVTNVGNAGGGWFIDDLALELRPIPGYTNGLTCADGPAWTIKSAYATGPKWAVDNNGVAAYTPDCSLNYNNGTSFACPAGATKVAGTAETQVKVPPLTVGTAKIYLTFRAYFDTDTAANVDVTSIDLNAPLAPVFHVVVDKSQAYKKWAEFGYDVTPYAGKLSYLRFVFDSMNCTGNAGAGVFIDDIVIREAP